MGSVLATISELKEKVLYKNFDINLKQNTRQNIMQFVYLFRKTKPRRQSVVNVQNLTESLAGSLCQVLLD